jgi:hypothetical protein
MSTATLSQPSSLRPAPAAIRPAVFLPKEHGSWSLALEPLLLALLIAPSWAGGALAGAVLAGFFARRPLKASFAAGDPVRRRDAREALAILGVLGVAGFLEAVVLGGVSALWPLVPAAGLGLWFARADGQGEARSMGAELAGSAAFALVPAAIATLAGRPPAVALALAALVLARSVSAVVTVRSYLRTAKGGAAAPDWPVFLSAATGVVLAGLAIADAAPAIAIVFGALFFARTLWLVGPWRPAWPARRVGQLEAGLGALYIILLAAAWPLS